MNISHLKVFIAIVQAASISKAADNLHLTQPAVSMQIQSLEQSIGYQLLIRSNRGVQLTEYGKLFLSYAQSFLTLWGNLQHDLKQIGVNDAVTLQVGTCQTIGQYALPCALYLFKQKYPQIGVSVQSLSSIQVIQEIQDHTLEVGFIEGQPKQDGFQSHLVLKSELLLVTSPDKECAPLHLSESINLPMILPPEDSDLRHALKCNFTTYGMAHATLKPFLELDGVEGIKSAVISGHGYAFLPYFTIKKELFAGELKPVPILDASLEITFTMIWRNDKENSKHSLSFIDFIRTEGSKSFC